MMSTPQYIKERHHAKLKMLMRNGIRLTAAETRRYLAYFAEGDERRKEALVNRDLLSKKVIREVTKTD